MKMEIDFRLPSVKWKQLYSENIVRHFTTMLVLQPEEFPSSSSSSTLCTSEDVQAFTHVNEIIAKQFLVQNERLPTVVCGNIVVHIVDHLQFPTVNTYSVKIVSVVKEVVADARKNKKTDYVIMRLVNQQTVVVVELKPIISKDLGYLEKELAQLFLEVYYVQKEDTKCIYQYMLAVLSDRQTWHMFILNLHLPIEVQHYYLYCKPTIWQICTVI